MKLLIMQFCPTFHSSSVLIFSSAPCPQIPPVYVLLLVTETNLTTRLISPDNTKLNSFENIWRRPIIANSIGISFNNFPVKAHD
jgi:hypothetical protein